MKTADFSSLLTRYLTHYLPVQRNLSSNTIRSYRDTFKLLLLFCRDEKKCNISKMTISKLDKKCIEEFLIWLTNTRGASASTYNQRLCAIHAFFDYVMAEEPGLMEQCVQVLDIPHKVTHAPPAHYLTPESLKLLLSMPDTSTRKGRRHLVLLTVLYDTAARVSELTDICLRDVRLEPPAVITLHGKGGKTRSVPLMKQTVTLLKDYFVENSINPQVRPDMPLFWYSRRQKLTRSGVTFILQKYAEMARKVSSDIPDHITPHIMRHPNVKYKPKTFSNFYWIPFTAQKEISFISSLCREIPCLRKSQSRHWLPYGHERRD